VLVVDDGSTDDSRARLAPYGDRVELVFTGHGGQAAALNAGLARARGDAVMFLDADDVLRPDAAALVAAALSANPAAVRVQFRMEVIDARGAPTGAVKPAPHLAPPSGDLRREQLAFPFDLAWMSYSAGGFRRAALERILPIPEREFAECPDWYLVHLAPLLGEVVSLPDVAAAYRVHGANRYERAAGELDLDHVRRSVAYAAATAGALQGLAAELGLARPRGPILSVADLANRLVSLKLEPALHPVPGDRAARLALDGVRAARRRFDSPWQLKLLYAGWFGLAAAAPRPLARALAGLLLPERRPWAAPLLRPLHARGRRAPAPGRLRSG